MSASTRLIGFFLLAAIAVAASGARPAACDVLVPTDDDPFVEAASPDSAGDGPLQQTPTFGEPQSPGVWCPLTAGRVRPFASRELLDGVRPVPDHPPNPDPLIKS